MSNTEFNWFTELDNAIKAEPTDDKFFDLERRASSWVTCACGELCKALPKGRNGQPENSYLYASGAEFTDAVHNKDWFYATIILERIEKKTIELLKELKL
ncbi:MAG: hypothetical protein [Cryophage ML09]|nr:MAG: hypothetical protein [Cryophage ML09]